MKKITWVLILVLFWSVIILTSLNLQIKISLLILSLCVVLWTSELIPMWMTGLIPLVTGPLFGLITLDQVMNNYFAPVIFLLLSGFIFSSAVSKWKIDKKIVYSITKIFGKNARFTILGIILATAFLSFFMPNTTSTALMLPVGLGILATTRNVKKQFRTSLILSIAYASSIGGTGVLIGTTTNLIGVEYMMRENIQIGFLSWSKMILPFTLILLVILWLYMTKRSKLPEKIVIDVENIKLSPQAKVVIIILLLTVIIWIIRPFISKKFDLPINDIGIGVVSALSFFFISYKSKPILQVKDTKIPWGIVLMVGGALAVGNILLNTGISDLFVETMSFLPKNKLVFLIATAVIANFSTELLSNTALSATLIPIIVDLYKSVGFDPFLGILTVAVCSDMAFMLPIATPPNAIVSKSKSVNFKNMISYGFWLNLIVIVLWVVYASLVF